MTENTLYLRVDDQNRETFSEARSFPPLNYAKKGSTVDLAFWRLPERLFDEPDEFIAWARAAMAAAQRVAANRTPTKRKSARDKDWRLESQFQMLRWSFPFQ